MRTLVCAGLMAVVLSPVPARAAAPRASMTTFTDANCLVPDRAAKPDRIETAQEVSRANGCVTLRDATGVLFYVMESELARSGAVLDTCLAKAGGKPKAPISAAQPAGAGTSKCP